MSQEQTGEAATPETGRYYYGTGRRKTAVARVRLYHGSGTIVVNGKPYLELFSRAPHQEKVRGPLTLVEMAESFNVQAKVVGGGVAAWADALSHGIARALVAFDERLRSQLRRGGFLTRDPRVKERKKYGLKRARKAPQYTKR
ncbi:MAG TPA: 30S ribosomal protein S9 [Dehalococcoidia bacterium]|nr:30S ribosomal protein S9 [Dehalococcoidia bacterium]